MDGKIAKPMLSGGLLAAILFDSLVGPFAGGVLAGYMFSKTNKQNATVGLLSAAIGLLLVIVVSIGTMLISGIGNLGDLFFFDPTELVIASIPLLVFTALTSIIGGLLGGSLYSRMNKINH
ncbi:DUF5518 domain-containing protein [Haloarchaeobius sp. DYHT-AS-18]|uniref:DUF5518 domain-containing protein n=1 Tax=Haloarchaeobius sp. DYHT-AS-18 TaxID=3446117 RepID=UPI003EBA0F4D